MRYYFENFNICKTISTGINSCENLRPSDEQENGETKYCEKYFSGKRQRYSKIKSDFIWLLAHIGPSF